MRNMRAAKMAAAAALFTVLLSAGAARGADVYDWAAAGQKAARASSQSDKEAAWHDQAYTHLRLAWYYEQLAEICAKAQIGIAERRASYDGTAAAAAAHGFIVTGQFDSAAAWTGKNATLRPLQQFAQAQAKGETFPYNGASDPAIEIALAGLHVTNDPNELKPLAGKLGKSSPVVSLVSTIISQDAAMLRAAIAKVEDVLTHPAGINNPLLDQYGDPLIYSALARAHALMAADVCETTIPQASSKAVPYLRFLRGMARYTLGSYDQAREDLNASAATDNAGIAYAYLAGIEWRGGNQSGAGELARKSLDAEKQSRRGEGLIALARVQSRLPGSDWGTESAAQEIIRHPPDSRVQVYAAYWAAALLDGDAQLDAANEMFWMAAGKLKPDVRHKFPDIYCFLQEAFCANYISALTSGGSHGNGLNYLDAFNGLMELAKFIHPTEPVKEGLRWLSLATNEDSEVRP